MKVTDDFLSREHQDRPTTIRSGETELPDFPGSLRPSLTLQDGLKLIGSDRVASVSIAVPADFLLESPASQPQLPRLPE
jgi:hypothetical protein